MKPLMKPVTQASAETQRKLALAQRIFNEYYARCFWHMDPALIVSEPVIPLIVKGLRHHGGRRGLLAAAQLEE